MKLLSTWQIGQGEILGKRARALRFCGKYLHRQTRTALVSGTWGKASRVRGQGTGDRRQGTGNRRPGRTLKLVISHWSFIRYSDFVIRHSRQRVSESCRSTSTSLWGARPEIFAEIERVHAARVEVFRHGKKLSQACHPSFSFRDKNLRGSSFGVHDSQPVNC